MNNIKFNLKIDNKILPFKKVINVDSDKSLTIRSFLIGSICNNITSISNALESEDVKSAIAALKKLGVKIVKTKSQKYKIFGKGLGSLNAKKNVSLNFGNSGTLARLLVGILSTTPNIEVRISGDNSLNKRSMKKLFYLMSKFGAQFLPQNKSHFPIKLISSRFPIAINYKAGVSAQLKSAVILAGLNAYGVTNIIESEQSRNHTENILESNSNSIEVKHSKNKFIRVYGKKFLKALNIEIPGDPSSAAFFAALTLLNKDSSIKINNVGINKTRIGFYDLIKKHGGNIKFINIKKKNNESTGDIIVKYSKIKPFKAEKSYYVNSTDEYPILFVIAALINGKSIFKGINDLANKESDRIKEMQKILKQIGVKTVFKKGELLIFGKGMIEATNKIINVPSLGDHRICMSTFILAILTGAKTKIKNFETVFTSSPSFLKIIKLLGAKFEIQKN